MNKKAHLEIIEPELGSSFTVKHFTEPGPDPNDKFWHFHPELELVYVKGGNGKRHIGNHLSYFKDGDLIFIGSNLPHYGFTNRLSGNDSETIIQMKADFLGKDFLNLPEMRDIALLFERAKYGIVFKGIAKYEIGEKIEKLPQLDTFDRLPALLSILHKMATSEDYEVLNALEYSFEVKLEDNERPEIIYNYVRKNFLEPISLEMIASEVNMTVPAFCRYFKKMSGKTFTKFVNEYRVVHACKLLSEEKISITEVCFQSGFNNFSHFTKVFKEKAGISPSAYRKKVKAIV